MTDPEQLNHDLIEAATIEPHSVDDVVDRLTAVQEIAEQRAPRYREDGLACFNYLYTRVTTSVREKIQLGDYFTDPEYLSTLDVEFAKRYLAAVAAHAAKRAVPRSWAVLLDRQSDESVQPLQFAIAGVNAHVNYDLAFALVSTWRIVGSEPGDDDQHRDYLRINEIFADHMQELRQHLESHLERQIDEWAFSALADGAGDLSVVLARDAAWHRADQLWRRRDDPRALAREAEALDWRIGCISRGILTFPLP